MRAGRSEKAIQNDELVSLSALPGGLFWRNNTGQAWQGKREAVSIGQMVKIEPGMIVLREARPVTFGLPGSGDILGVYRGSAVAVEVKTQIGRQSDQQRLFESAWKKAGGVYILSREAGYSLRVLTDTQERAR